jgi:hypothetical protein
MVYALDVATTAGDVCRPPRSSARGPAMSDRDALAGILAPEMERAASRTYPNPQVSDHLHSHPARD